MKVHGGSGGSCRTGGSTGRRGRYATSANHFQTRHTMSPRLLQSTRRTRAVRLAVGNDEIAWFAEILCAKPSKRSSAVKGVHSVGCVPCVHSIELHEPLNNDHSNGKCKKIPDLCLVHCRWSGGCLITGVPTARPRILETWTQTCYTHRSSDDSNGCGGALLPQQTHVCFLGGGVREILHGLNGWEACLVQAPGLDEGPPLLGPT